MKKDNIRVLTKREQLEWTKAFLENVIEKSKKELESVDLELKKIKGGEKNVK